MLSSGFFQRKKRSVSSALTIDLSYGSNENVPCLEVDIISILQVCSAWSYNFFFYVSDLIFSRPLAVLGISDPISPLVQRWTSSASHKKSALLDLTIFYVSNPIFRKTPFVPDPPLLPDSFRPWSSPSAWSCNSPRLWSLSLIIFHCLIMRKKKWGEISKRYVSVWKWRNYVEIVSQSSDINIGLPSFVICSKVESRKLACRKTNCILKFIRFQNHCPL